MQVSQVIETDNFAVIGGREARAFRIGNNASAFKILSDSLYSNKIRAVVREVLCNAVNSHIAGGITDKPIEVMLNDAELIIRDFGAGIPDDRMIEIYATYFGSTKQSDDSQTGGFGLGSKSPFAYTEHFTVTSCHGGMKRIYALTIGDEDTDGAPAVKLMVEAPTTESGVTVSVPIQASDRYRFNRDLEEVVAEGGMNVLYNGEKLETRDYSELRAKGVGLFLRLDGSRIKVLYGNVLYPLDTGSIPCASSLFPESDAGEYELVIHAPPSSIAVTPSRESISYNPRTIETLNKLVRGIKHRLKGHESAARRKAMTAFIEGNNLTRANVATHWLRGERFYDGGETPFICGEREIVEFYAKRAVDRRLIDYSTFFKFAGRYFRERQGLREIDGAVFDLPHRWMMEHKCDTSWFFKGRSKRIRLFEEQHHYLVRKLLRTIPAEFHKDLYYATVTGEYFATRPITKSRRGLPRSCRMIADPYALYIAPNRPTAVSAGKSGFYLIGADLSDEQRAEIERKAEWFRFKLTELEKAAQAPRVPKPKVVKAEPLYRPVGYGKKRYHSRINGTMMDLPTPIIKTPASFLAWSPSRSKGIGASLSTDNNQPAIFEELNKLYPNVALAVTVSEVQALQKMDVPRIETLILTELKEAGGLDNFPSRLKRVIAESSYYHSGSVGHLLVDVAKTDLRLAGVMLGYDYDTFIQDRRKERVWRLGEWLLGQNRRIHRWNYGNLLAEDAHHQDIQEFNALVEQREKMEKTEHPAIEKILTAINYGDSLDKLLPHFRFAAKILELGSLDEAEKRQVAAYLRSQIPTAYELDDNGDQL